MHVCVFVTNVYFFVSAYNNNIFSYNEQKLWIIFAGFLYQISTSEKFWLFFKQIEVTYRNSISNYELMRRAAKKTVVIIFGVTHAKLYEYTSRTEAFTCIGNESLD